MQLDQRLIIHHFDQAAINYLRYAHIQKNPAQKIITLLPNYHNNGLILDLGSGPGTFTHSETAKYATIAYDISLNMLKAGKNNLSINGDAHSLPFADKSISTVISNLMLQWPKHKAHILAEIKRVLLPNGTLIFTTLIQPSLWQLQQAWHELDSVPHTLEFLSLSQYYQLCQQSGFKVISCQSWENIRYFTNLSELLRHFKLTGTSLPKSNRGQGLGGRNILSQLEHIYAKYKTEQGLPLSYNYLMITAQNGLDL